MKAVLSMALRFAVLLLVPLGSALISAKPAPGQNTPTHDYSNLSQSVKGVVATMKRLKVRIEAGLTNLDAFREIPNTNAEIRLFLESREGANYPELCFLLSNTMYCYQLLIDETRITFESPSTDLGYHMDNPRPAKATAFLAQWRPLLLKVASANIVSAEVLVEGSPDEITAFLRKTLPANRRTLTLAGSMADVIKGWQRSGQSFSLDGMPASLVEGIRQQATEEAKEAHAEKRRIANENRLAMEERRRLEDNAKWRTWTSADGARSVEAKFIKEGAETICIEKRDKTRIDVPKEKLCQEDLDWVKQKGWHKGLPPAPTR